MAGGTGRGAAAGRGGAAPRGGGAARGAGARSSRAAGPRAAAPGGGLALLELCDAGGFPSSFYLEGPCEPLKAAFLAELRAAWARAVTDAPLARVLRAAEAGVEAILAAVQGGSLFASRELTLVLDIEDLARSEKRVAALAAGLGAPSGGSCLVLVESAAEQTRKSLAPLRAACAARWEAGPPSREDLARWGARRLRRAGIAAGEGAVEALVRSAEGDALAFFSELETLVTGCAPGATLTRETVESAMRPVVGADLPDYLSAVAHGYPGLAAQRLGRLLAAGADEGRIVFGLANLVGGALGGWAKWPELSRTLRARLAPRELTRAADAIYRAEAAWKGGRADIVAALEATTRALATPAH
uniref:DNA polymerase III subunit delta n=1 Tax=Eiseniibacteriota bacterium TaxID=2212470 RepID=A0A832I255_UNCEI